MLADDDRADAGFIGLLQGFCCSAAQLAEAVLRTHPQGEIEIAAFVPDLDPSRRNSQKGGTSPQSGLATEPITAIASTSARGRPRLDDHIGRQPEPALMLDWSSISARRIASFQKLHEIALAAEPRLERCNMAVLFGRAS